VLNNGEIIDVGPDHYARLAAVGRLVQIMTAGRPIPKPREEKRENGLLDYDQLRRVVQATKLTRCRPRSRPGR
jgi:hypothetical protein